MSEQRHCDHCGKVIPTSERFLTLKPGTAKANLFHEDEYADDYHKACALANGQKIINKIIADQDWGPK